jgi:GTPase
MLPTIVLVGRPNVGKSTLFNRLTHSSAALVADLPGLTRDRHYGQARLGDRVFIVVDTGGLEPQATDGIFRQMANQTRQAIAEADAVVLIVDVRQGLMPQDRAIAEELRRLERPVLVAVNKAEGMVSEIAAAEFFELGLGEPATISAAHNEGVRDLIERALARLPEAEEVADDAASKHPKIAVIGRPNVGKSTLINRFIGEERLVTFDQPGTTRDSIYVDFTREGKPYTLIDTAGIRRRGRVSEVVEKFSVVKTLQAVQDANVVILVLDASQDISEQDAHIGGFILEAGRALVLAINKWDAPDSYKRETSKREIGRKLKFLDFAEFHYVSALQGTGLSALFRAVDVAYAAAMVKMPTPKLTKILHAATTQHQPPQHGPFRPRLKYAHQGGSNPPRIVVHGTAIRHIPTSYQRYLENRFRDAFALFGTPLRVEFRQGRNPYADK